MKEGEGSTSANTQPSGVDSQSQEKSVSAPQDPSDSENTCPVEEDKTKPSSSDPECSGTTPPLSALSFVKSLYQRSVAVEKKQEGGMAASPNKASSAVCSNSNLMKKSSNSAIAQPNRNPPPAGRRRGRPPKNRPPPESGGSNQETRESEPTETQAEPTPAIDSNPADNPVPVKRGRGRPPKNRGRPGRPPGSSSKSDEDKPFIPVYSFKTPATEPNADAEGTDSPGQMKTSRPLTRGALGKDFPSAKKRSWIDIEKELDPEPECE